MLAALGGGGAIVFSLSAWLGKVWADRLMQREVARHSRELEELRSDLSQRVLEHKTRFERIDAKQAEVILYVHGKLNELFLGQRRIKSLFEHRAILEDVDQKYHRPRREPWQLVPGIHTLSSEEEAGIKVVMDASSDLNQYFERHRLYLPRSTCDLINRSLVLTWYVADAYHNVALKDDAGNLVVHPDVKRVWDAAHETMPELMAKLESDFRQLVGVDPPEISHSAGVAPTSPLSEASGV